MNEYSPALLAPLVVRAQAKQGTAVDRKVTQDSVDDYKETAPA